MTTASPVLSPAVPRSVTATAARVPMRLKIPVAGVVVLVLLVLMALSAHGTTSFALATRSDLLALPVLTVPARATILVQVVPAVAATAWAWWRSWRREDLGVGAAAVLGVTGNRTSE